MFDLKKPCKDCPFLKRNGKKFALRPERIAEIGSGEAFQCHKTLDGKPQQCAGLISIQSKTNNANTITRIATYFTDYDPKNVDGSETYDSLQNAIEGHQL